MVARTFSMVLGTAVNSPPPASPRRAEDGRRAADI